MGHYDDRDYAVGKGKPPAEHRFQKGKSGNPRGPSHKKKARDATLEVLAHEAVNEMISATIGGREQPFLQRAHTKMLRRFEIRRLSSKVQTRGAETFGFSGEV